MVSLREETITFTPKRAIVPWHLLNSTGDPELNNLSTQMQRIKRERLSAAEQRERFRQFRHAKIQKLKTT